MEKMKPEIDTRLISRLKCAKCHVFVRKNAEKCPSCGDIFIHPDEWQFQAKTNPLFFN